MTSKPFVTWSQCETPHTRTADARTAPRKKQAAASRTIQTLEPGVATHEALQVGFTLSETEEAFRYSAYGEPCGIRGVIGMGGAWLEQATSCL
jgi:hypothetical protein